jgi:hypothetical protein
MELQYQGLNTQLYFPPHLAGRDLCMLFLNTIQHNSTFRSKQHHTLISIHWDHAYARGQWCKLQWNMSYVECTSDDQFLKNKM